MIENVLIRKINVMYVKFEVESNRIILGDKDIV